MVLTTVQSLLLRRHRWAWQCRQTDGKLSKEKISKENLAAVELPFWITCTVSSAGLGHLKNRRGGKTDSQQGNRVKSQKRRWLKRHKVNFWKRLYSALMRSWRTGQLALLTGVAQQESRTVESCRSSTPSARTSTYNLSSISISAFILLVEGEWKPASWQGVILK